MSAIGIEGVCTSLTRFEGIDLRAAGMPTRARLGQTRGDSRTRPPEGLRASASWRCSGD